MKEMRINICYTINTFSYRIQWWRTCIEYYQTWSSIFFKTTGK